MGVPVFFKWLCMRNPKIILDAYQPDFQDIQSGNPVVDNFYVDMNGLIHPACNPKGQKIKQPKNFEEQCENIYEYMDKLMNIIRPRKLLYLAIDGVAPRAKMNQQRSRRFRAAMQGAQVQKQKQKLLDQYKKMEINNPQIEQYVNKTGFDSNMITPGTPFLSAVCQKLREYIKNKIVTDKLWKQIIVVFSDANCPGQGEHKIMDFIRQERASQNYNPNLSHCIYGADADLIMLSLATHQPRFYIIREIVITANDKWCTTCGKKGHYFTDCRIADSIEGQMRTAQQMNAQSIGVSFQIIKIKAVREYIHINYMNSTFNPSFSYDLERIIDDFVFLCFFVGNDFLPHIPCLSIRQGGIDVLMRVYDYCLKIMPDYLTNVGQLNMKSLKVFMKQLSSYQNELVSQIISKQAYQKQKQQFDKNIKGNKTMLDSKNSQPEPDLDFHNLLQSFKEQIKKRTNPQQNIQDYSVFNHQIYSYKEKYYTQKFRITPMEFLQLKNSISKSYIEALQWICKYYYSGVPSWSWYYPFHYSPFLTDIKVPNQNWEFNLGTPFKPFQQLMGVMPPKTCKALPQSLHHLMLDVNSPISDYFPSNFMIDLVGKKFAWLGQVLLPFIDSDRLLNAMGDYQVKLTQQEKKLNKLGINNLYIGRYSPLGRILANSQKINVGSFTNLNHQEHSINGEVVVVSYEKQALQYTFLQPFGLKHDINLKQGIYSNPLQQLEPDFISRTDRKSFGGQRFVRIIQKSLGRKIQISRRRDNLNNYNNRQQNQNQRQRQPYQRRQYGQDRDRSRDYRDNRQGNNSQFNNRRGSNNNYDNSNRNYNNNRQPRRDNYQMGNNNRY